MKKVSNKIGQFDLMGMLVPFNPFTGKPVLLELNGDFLLPLFTSEEKYNSAMDWAGFKFARIKKIVDAADFVQSVVASKREIAFHVVVDPYITSEGNTRFQLIPFDLEEASYLGENNGQEP